MTVTLPLWAVIGAGALVVVALAQAVRYRLGALDACEDYFATFDAAKALVFDDPTGLDEYAREKFDTIRRFARYERAAAELLDEGTEPWDVDPTTYELVARSAGYEIHPGEAPPFRRLEEA